MKPMLIMQDACCFQSQQRHHHLSLYHQQDALYLHFDRANYQCHQWKMALRLHHEFDPIDHGWVNDNGILGIHLKECKPAPEAILEFVTCSCCKSECVTNQCGFVNLCKDICLCKSCKNSNKDTNTHIKDMFDDDVYDSHDEYSEDEYDSDDEENSGKLFLDDKYETWGENYD